VDDTARFLISLFADTISSRPDYYLELTLLDDRYKEEPPEWEGGKKRRVLTGWLPMRDINEKLPGALARAQVRNVEGYGVYFGVGARHERAPKGARAKKSSIATLPALWLDLDCGGDRVGWAIEKLNRFTLPPTMIVSTGGGVQAWWVLRRPFVIEDEQDRKNFEFMLAGLAKVLDGDGAVADVARIMRLPGFANMKPDRDGYIAKIEYEEGELYDITQFWGYIAIANPPRPQFKQPARVRRDGERPRMTNLAERFLSDGAPEGQRHRTLIHAAFQMKEKGFGFQECWEEAGQAALACGLPEQEASKAIRWVYTQGEK
jgi:hypothetical protein